MGYRELVQILHLGTKLMNSVAKSREGKADWGEGFTDHRMIIQRRRSGGGRESSLSRAKGPGGPCRPPDSASSRKCELVQKRAAMELSLKSN